MDKVLLHSNGSAKNHGCEAIALSTLKIFNLKKENVDYVTYNENEERLYYLDEKVNLLVCKQKKIKPKSVKYYFSRIIEIFIDKDYNNRKIIGDFATKIKLYKYAIALGGDNYCYRNAYKYLKLTNDHLFKKKIKSILWGVSIEPEVLKIKEVQLDLNKYYAIFARESITFDSLLNAGFSAKIYLYPDPAFALETIYLPLPSGFIENKTIGINLSPLIQSLDMGNDITFKNYEKLIEFIINTTDYQIALIPHVVWDYNNDLDSLKILFDKFEHTGRIVLIEDHNCMELKGYIARCRMFIGARTHATIAAYSSYVPTLTVGYSVKAKGIAKDIFGTYENYVISVQSLVEESDLTNAFIWILEREQSIKEYLKNYIPKYVNKLTLGSDLISKML